MSADGVGTSIAGRAGRLSGQLLAALVLIASLWAADVGAQKAAPLYLVIPFENAKDEARLYWLSEGLSILLADDLRALGGRALTRDERLRAIERMNLPRSATLSHATVIRIGQLLGATHVLIGAFELQGDVLSIRARAIQLDSGRMLPEIAERGPIAEVFALHARLARRLVPETTIRAEQMEQGQTSLPAFEQYVKGLLAEVPATRRTYLEQALKLAPTFWRVRLALWQEYADRGEHLAALNAIREVPDGHSLTRRARLRGALSMLELGRHAEAHETFMMLHRQQPDAALVNNLGVIQVRRPPGTLDNRSVEFFGEAVKLDPADPDLFFNLGYASWFAKDPSGAIAALREAVRRNPADGQAHYVLGVALQATGSTPEANREKELARRLSSTFAEWESTQPQSMPVPQGLERLKGEVDLPESLRIESALVATEQREQRQLALFHLDRARRLFEQKRDTEAITELRRVVYLTPYEAEAHLFLGRIHLRTGRLSDAIDALKISIWSEDTLPARLALAEALIQAKEMAAARIEVEHVLAKDPSNSHARQLRESLSR